MNPFTNQSILPGTINLFINSLCNFACKHCYATFQDIPGAKLPKLSEADALAIIRQIADEPLGENLLARKITFVGGEPTLHPALPSLVKYAKDLGLVTAVITNGLTLNPRYLEQFAGKLDWVGLSIDGLDSATNKQIGRATRAGRYLDELAYLQRIEWLKAIGAQLKINTVVSRLNSESDLSEFIVKANPVRWKILQVTPVEGQNDQFIKLLQIDRSTFDQFVARHSIVETLGRQRHLFFLTALTHGFCYRVLAVASVECYPKSKAINGNYQQSGAEGNCGISQNPIWAIIKVGKRSDPAGVHGGFWIPSQTCDSVADPIRRSASEDRNSRRACLRRGGESRPDIDLGNGGPHLWKTIEGGDSSPDDCNGKTRTLGTGSGSSEKTDCCERGNHRSNAHVSAKRSRHTKATAAGRVKYRDRHRTDGDFLDQLALLFSIIHL